MHNLSCYFFEVDGNACVVTAEGYPSSSGWRFPSLEVVEALVAPKIRQILQQAKMDRGQSPLPEAVSLEKLRVIPSGVGFGVVPAIQSWRMA